MASIVGSIYGGIAAYFGGVVDDVMMRIVEILLSVPYLLIVILISVVTDSKSLGTMLVALTLTGWCGIARIVRGQMLQLKSQEFVLAANALGGVADEDDSETYDSGHDEPDYRCHHL